MSANQDDVELVNRTLRDAGLAAHCHWIQNPDEFDALLCKNNVELVILNCDDYADAIRQVIRQKDAYKPEVPVIAMCATVDENAIIKAMNSGACDLVSSEKKAHLQAVVNRELRAFRVERALNSTLHSANEYRRQLNDYVQDSSSAIAYTQEGIIIEVNNSWCKLFQAKDKEDMLGLPLMDSFIDESHAAIKGAVVATTQGKWQKGEKLIVNSRHGEDNAVSLELEFQLTDLDDGPYVRVLIAPDIKVLEEPTKLVHEALKRDPTTLLFHRAQFLERIGKRLKRKPQSGLHALVYIKPDDFKDVCSSVGYIDSEEVFALFAEEMRKRLHPRDIAGRFEGTALMALLERGNERDAKIWGQQLVEHIQKQEFIVGSQKVQLTCTVGVIGISSMYGNIEEMAAAAIQAHKHGRSEGGNAVFLSETNDVDTRQRKYDEIWVKRIKSALLEKRFQLAQLPIAGLRSDTNLMFDMLVRMLDEQGEPILPSEFLPAAERNNLITAIDRWITTASIEYCANNDVNKVFVRLSRQSMQDPNLLNWLQKELDEHAVEPGKVCVQIPEQDAAKFIKETQKTAADLRGIGVDFALEHYGVDKNRFQILDLLKPNYIKINGELMHSLTTNTDLQESVKQLAAAAEQRGIGTIAERVENANAMAVLFQLGVHFMQGHYVHEPEVILQEAASVALTTLEAISS